MTTITTQDVRMILLINDKRYSGGVSNGCYGHFLQQLADLLHPSIDLADVRDGGKYNLISTLRSLQAFATGVSAHSGPEITLVDSKPKFVIADGVTALDSIKGALSPDEFTAYCKGVALQKIFEGDVDSLAEAATYLNKAVANA